jgi:Ni2+-binding GTPase involved in maturation of urease and hydrogenase
VLTFSALKEEMQAHLRLKLRFLRCVGLLSDILSGKTRLMMSWINELLSTAVTLKIAMGI